MSAQIISNAELGMILRTRYPNAHIRLLDDTYNIPVEEAFQTYLKELGRRLFEFYGDTWKDYFDCDNYMLEAMALAYRKHWIASQNGEGNAQGVALGGVVIDSLRHAVCVRLTPAKKLEEFEPQNRQPIQLTQSQCESVSLVLFF